MGLSNLNCVISQVVVHDVWKIFTDCEETKYLLVVVQELFLRSNFSTTEALFEVLKEFNVSLWRNRNARLCEGVSGFLLSVWLGSALELKITKVKHIILKRLSLNWTSEWFCIEVHVHCNSLTPYFWLSWGKGRLKARKYLLGRSLL